MSASIAVGLLLLGLLALAGCGGAGGGGGGSSNATTSTDGAAVSSGTLGGKSFSVIYGTVTQSAADGPITADAEGALIAFDDAISTWGLSDNTRTRVQFGFTMQDEGSITVMGFGQSLNGYVNGLRVILLRDGADVDYATLFGTTNPAGGTASPAPADAAGAMTLTAEFFTGTVPGYGSDIAAIELWHPDDPTAAFCDDIARPKDSSFVTDGDELGVLFISATLNSLTTDDPVGPCE
jgi:hypothetical protein